MNNRVKVIFLFGEPGSGKTFLFKKLLKHYGTFKTVYLSNFCYESFKTPDNRDVYMLGKYDNHTFSGTDRISMSCQPIIESYIKNFFSGIFLIEGDRLCNEKFFTFCARHTNFKPFFLLTSEEKADDRRKLRKSNQSLPWIKGRQTKIHRLREKFEYRTVLNENDADAESCFLQLKDEIEEPGHDGEQTDNP